MNLEPYTSTTVIPSRTKYQLRHFVVGVHDTAPMQWRQILLEAQDMAYKIRMAELGVEKAHIEIDRLSSSGDPIEAIEAEEKRIGLALTERTLVGARMELGWLQELAEEVGPHTAEEIEADQEEYWKLRLKRQAGLDQMSLSQGVSSGNLQSMLNAGLLEPDKKALRGPNDAGRITAPEPVEGDALA